MKPASHATHRYSSRNQANVGSGSFGETVDGDMLTNMRIIPRSCWSVIASLSQTRFDGSIRSLSSFMVSLSVASPGRSKEQASQ